MSTKKASDSRDEMIAKILKAIRECEEETGLTVQHFTFKTHTIVNGSLRAQHERRYETSVSYE